MLTAASTTALVETGFQDFSVAALIILGFVISVAVGIFVFHWGWRKIKHSSR